MRASWQVLILFAAASSLPVGSFAADRAALIAFADAFEAGDVATMHSLMTDELRTELSAEKLAQLRRALLGGAKAFRDVEVSRGRYFVGSVRLSGFQTKTQNEKFVVRLLEGEDEKQYSGLDIVPDDQEREMPTADRCFGALPARYAVATGEIELEPVGVDGKPLADASVQLWHAIDGDRHDGWSWHEQSTNRWWEPVLGKSSSPRKFDRLEPGLYRPVVWEIAGTGFVGVGEPIKLDELLSKERARVPIELGGRLEVRCVDAETGGALPEPRVHAVAIPHPIWQQQFPFSAEPIDGEQNAFVFAKLPAGTYRLSAERLARNPDDDLYEMTGHVEAAVQPGETTRIVLKISKRRMTREEINRRWPWVVHGRVTDPNGAPVADAVVRAHSGYGSLFSTGATVTDADGNYRLHFGISGFILERPAVYYAQITASKPGMYEVNLNLQGQLAAAEPNAEYGREFYRPNQNIQIHEPRELNFVLAPAGDLAIRVRTEKHREAQLDGLAISLKGDVMPPGCSVVNSGRTDRWGSIEVAGVPLGHPWYVEIEADGHEAVRTQPFRLTEPQRYSLELRWRSDGEGKDRLEIVAIEDALGRDRTMTSAAIER